MDKKPSILFLINNLGVGGAEKVFVDDANSLYRDGYSIFFGILYGDKGKSPLLNKLEIPNENIIFIKAKNLFDFSGYFTLRSFIKKNKISILYSTLHDAIFFSRVVSFLTFKLKLVTREANLSDKKTFLHKLSDQIMNVRVNKIISVSEEVKRSMLKYQPWYASKTQILPNGASVSGEPVSPNKNKVILTVGSLTSKKAQNVLIEAFSRVSVDYPDYTLKIVGEGVLGAVLREKAASLGLQSKVVFTGNLSNEEVCDLYKNSSIFVLSSDQEGSPNALLEAMSYGLPSIGTNVGAIPEIIVDGVSGLIVPKQNPELLSDAIKKLLESVELRVSVGEAGRNRVLNDFSQSEHISKLKSILR